MKISIALPQTRNDKRLAAQKHNPDKLLAIQNHDKELRNCLITALQSRGELVFHSAEKTSDTSVSGTFARISPENFRRSDLLVADVTSPCEEVRSAIITTRTEMTPVLLIHSASFAPTLPPETIISPNGQPPIDIFAYTVPSDLISSQPKGAEQVNKSIVAHESIGKAFQHVRYSELSFLDLILALTKKDAASAPSSVIPFRRETA